MTLYPNSEACPKYTPLKYKDVRLNHKVIQNTWARHTEDSGDGMKTPCIEKENCGLYTVECLSLQVHALEA